MSLRLLIDEDSQAKVLVSILRSAGHDVRTVSEEGLEGNDDAVILAQAHARGRALLTRNADDYAELHEAGSQHSGILVVFRGPTRGKNMNPADVIRAVGNLDQSGLDMKGQLVPLNAWNY